MPGTGKKVTMKDVAAKAGVSAAAVSMFLNGRAKEYKIADATCKRIEEAVSELGYIPNLHAQTIRTGKTHLVCFCVADDLSHSFWGRILNTFEDTLSRQGWHVLTVFSRHDAERQKHSLEVMERLGVDGFAVAPVGGTEHEIRELGEKYPLVVLNRRIDGLSCVRNDDTAGIRNAVETLLARGYNHPVFLSKVDSPRRAAFLEATGEHGLPGVLYDSVESLLADTGKFDAVVCQSDYAAQELYLKSAAEDLRIPDDFAVVGYDNMDFSSWLLPSLSTVNQYKEELGTAGAEMLLKLIRTPGRILERSFTPELIVRKSIRKKNDER